MIDIKQYIKERGFDESYILVNNHNDRIPIGNLLEGFDNLLQEQVKKLNIDDVSISTDY